MASVPPLNPQQQAATFALEDAKNQAAFMSALNKDYMDVTVGRNKDEISNTSKKQDVSTVGKMAETTAQEVGDGARKVIEDNKDRS